MERDLGTTQVYAGFKTNSHVNAILQEFKSMRQDMKMEFAQVQENMNDMVSKILAETKKDEIMHNAMQFEETSQPSVADSGINICFQESYSEKKVSQTKSSDAITSVIKDAI
ncbi:unnamed protein product [Clavelina lepadiformis]|uniref:Uncharacterized protein n=1 Tax=Clavelina lepadiformis TaxID=159417 RepID=A0ABP0GIM5_CLALP